MRTIVADRMRVYALATMVWGLGQALGILTLAPANPERYHAANGALIAVALGTLLASRSARLGSRGITALGVMLGITQLIQTSLFARFTGEVIFVWTIPVAFIGAGGLVLDGPLLGVFFAGGTAAALTLGRLPGHAFLTDALLLAAGIAVGAVLHVVGRRYVLSIERLRERDRRHHEALEAALAEARRQLADRERAEEEGARLREQLTQAQKMEAVGTLAGGFAHDMNNVLGGILAVAEMLREEAPAKHHDDLDGIIASTQRGAELTRNLLGFARRGKYRRERVELAAVIKELVRLLTRTVPKGVVFETQLAEPSPAVEGDPALITQALVNLCLNSVDAMRGVGRVGISATEVEIAGPRAVTLELEPGRYVEIEVRDTGAGMSPDTARRVFEPFFTTKEVGRGTGLGLSMVYGTMRSYGGAVAIDSTLGVGTTMRLFLPSAAPVPTQLQARTSAVHSTHAIRTGGGTVLVVDDDDAVRRVARRILVGKGYQVIEASNGQEALEVFDRERQIDLVVLDMAMPVMGGAECFRALRARSPEVRVLLASGYTIEEDARQCLAAGAKGFLDKPYTMSSFITAVERALRDLVVEAAEQRSSGAA